MGIKNKYSSWYDKYNKKEDNRSPYRIKIIKNDIGEPVLGFENEIVDAVSSAQARVIFFKKFNRLYDYLAMGYSVEAELDEELLRQRKEIAELERQAEEESIQNAWWQD